MAKQKKIVRIICPNCEKNYLFEKKMSEKIKLLCPDCVYIWTEEHFKRFKHLEKFIIYKKDNEIGRMLNEKMKVESG